MGNQEEILASNDYQGFEKFVFESSTLVSSHPPPFIFVNDPTTPRITSSTLDSVLSHLSKSLPASPVGPSRICYAHVNAVACFTARLLFDSILNGLTKWHVKWDDGCANWNVGDNRRWNENFDGFLHGLRAIHAGVCKLGTEPNMTVMPNGHRLGNGKEGKIGTLQIREGDVRVVIVIDRTERLKETLPDLVVPLTRLAELSQIPVTVVFISEVQWEDMRPSLGASPDPYYIDITPLTKEVIVQRLTTSFLATGAPGPSAHDPHPSPYHPALQPLYSHFVSILCSVCYPFTQNPQELAYVAAARWPGFAKPVLDEHRHRVESLRLQEDTAHNHEIEQDGGDVDIELTPPSEDARMRLARLFTSSFTTALEALYPRLMNASDWALENLPENDILVKQPGYSLSLTSRSDRHDTIGMEALTRTSKFILVAAFLASTNPPKSDLRMFGRGLDEKKRRRRPTKTAGRTKGGPAKILQRLLGPAPFPLDRLIAMLGALLEENDVDTRPPAPEFTVPGEYTDMEIGRVGIYASIMDLTSMRLLHRTSPPDKLDGPPMFKCGVSYDTVLALARQLDVPLNDLMWDPA